MLRIDLEHGHVLEVRKIGKALRLEVATRAQSQSGRPGAFVLLTRTEADALVAGIKSELPEKM